jgi:nicotinate-nucleotide pyrophosphorylase (carboxylating)
LERAYRNRRGSQTIQIEVRTMSELEEALGNGAEALLLDNMSVEQVRTAVARCRRELKHVPLEASGGITINNVRDYAETGVDFVSVGALTHSPVAADMNLRIQPV